MAKITGNCELELYSYCKTCNKYIPWVTKEEYPYNDENGFLVERKEYRIVCRHGEVCQMWNS